MYLSMKLMLMYIVSLLIMNSSQTSIIQSSKISLMFLVMFICASMKVGEPEKFTGLIYTVLYSWSRKSMFSKTWIWNLC